MREEWDSEKGIDVLEGWVFQVCFLAISPHYPRLTFSPVSSRQSKPYDYDDLVLQLTV